MSHKTRSWSQSLKQLLDSAKEKNNMLDYSEMIDFCEREELDAKDFEKILECLEEHKVQLINGDETLQADEELEMEMGQENSAGPETERGRMDDPVKMYLADVSERNWEGAAAQL